jgi:hypothetical protein
MDQNHYKVLRKDLPNGTSMTKKHFLALDIPTRPDFAPQGD